MNKRQQWRRALLVAASSALISATGQAEDRETTSGELARHLLLPIFDILDCTDQGFLEAGEVDEHFPNLFGYHDRNRDFSLSLREYAVSGDVNKRRMDQLLFERMDNNSDGKVSPLEYRSEVMSIIESMDADGDGETSLEELAPPESKANAAGE